MLTKIIKLYPDRQDVTLTTYVLDDSTALLNGKKRPAVIVCPGGAYLYCSDREAEPVALRYAAMGYHAFVLRYSTYSGEAEYDFSNPDLSVNPNSIHPAPMRDIGKAFLTIREHADEWLVDMDKVAICGFSAGAHNCAMYSVYWDKPIIYEFFDEKPSQFKPALAIIAYGIGDYHITGKSKPEPTDNKLSQAASIAFLGTTSPTPEQLDELSPAMHFSKNTPPTFLWATAADALVPPENTAMMAAALSKAGVPFEAHIFEEGQHGLSLADQTTANAAWQIDGNAAKWVTLVEAWMMKRFALPVPEESA